MEDGAHPTPKMGTDSHHLYVFRLCIASQKTGEDSVRRLCVCACTLYVVFNNLGPLLFDKWLLSRGGSMLAFSHYYRLEIQSSENIVRNSTGRARRKHVEVMHNEAG